MEQEMKSPAAAPAAATPATTPAAAAPASTKITIEDFAKVEMRVGKVLTAEKVAGADKLLKLTVDIGEEVRQIVAGIAEVDKYLVENEPWALAEDPAKRARLATVLYTSAEALRVVTALAHPVLPQATEKIWQQLGQRGLLARQQLDNLKWGQLASGDHIGQPEPVFPRIKKDETSERIETMEQDMKAPPAAPAAAATPAAAAPASTKITIEDFAKIEMRVGKVLTAEKSPTPISSSSSPWISATKCARLLPASRKCMPQRRSSAARWWWSSTSPRANSAAWNPTA